MYNPDEHKNAFIFCMKSLSPLLQFEELTEPEWQSLVTLLEMEYPNRLIQVVSSKASFIKQKLSDLLLDCENQEMAVKEERRLYRCLYGVFRAVIYAMRKSKEFEGKVLTDERFLEYFEKAWRLQDDELVVELINITYKTFDLKFNMHFIFLAISNSSILTAMKHSIDPNKTSENKLQILIRVLHDARIITQIKEMDESEEFILQLIPQLKMSQSIDSLPLFRSLNTVFSTHLSDWLPSPEPSELQYTVLLSSDVNRKIRKDTAVFIDIKLPQKIIITYIPSEDILIFEKGHTPSSRMAKGGFWLGELVKIRALSNEEIKAIDGVKNLEATISAGYGVYWALKLLGANTTNFLTSLDTLWWYFRVLED